jgi:Flp pilus assembly secretin CpaC
MVVDPTIGEVVRITTKDVSITGRTRGTTHVTFFFEDEKQPQLTYLLEVTPEPTNK